VECEEGGKEGCRGMQIKVVIHISVSFTLFALLMQPCPICMSKLSEQSGFEDDDALSTAPGTLDVYRLRKCGHKLHTPCLVMYLKNSSKVGYVDLGGKEIPPPPPPPLPSLDAEQYIQVHAY
jgi:hypothetical protein